MAAKNPDQGFEDFQDAGHLSDEDEDRARYQAAQQAVQADELWGLEGDLRSKQNQYDLEQDLNNWSTDEATELRNLQNQYYLDTQLANWSTPEATELRNLQYAEEDARYAAEQNARLEAERNQGLRQQALYEASWDPRYAAVGGAGGGMVSLQAPVRTGWGNVLWAGQTPTPTPELDQYQLWAQPQARGGRGWGFGFGRLRGEAPRPTGGGLGARFGRGREQAQAAPGPAMPADAGVRVAGPSARGVQWDYAAPMVDTKYLTEQYKPWYEPTYVPKNPYEPLT